MSAPLNSTGYPIPPNDVIAIQLVVDEMLRLGYFPGSATTYGALTDAASVNLPAVNTPLATALSGKVSSVAAGTNVTITGTAQNPIVNASGGGGSVATDAIWDAAGDIVVGTGPNTSARLPIGTPNQQQRVNAGGTALEYFTPSAGSGANLTGSGDANTYTVFSDTGSDATLPSATSSAAGVATAAQITKLNGVATGATANSSDAALLAIANHTGLGAGVLTFLQTPSSANLLAAVTDESGTGNLLFSTAPSMSAPVISGIAVTSGANITTANAIAALAIDTTLGLNTKSISADSTFTFSGAPATANTWFSLLVTNTDAAPHVLTLPSAFDMNTQSIRTTTVIPASGKLYLLWNWNGANYNVFGASPFLNNFIATSAPTVNEDVADGYGAGSFWYNATTNILYICESNGAAAAVWTALNSGGGGDALTTNPLSQFAATTSAQLLGVISDETGTGSLVFGTRPTITGALQHLNALPTSNNTYEGKAVIGINAGATIAQWEAVYLGSGGTWLLADANVSGTFPCRGLAVAAYVNTNAAIVLDDGIARNDAWAWTVGADVYLSATAGGLTQTVPATSGDKVQKIGYALTADSIRINIGSAEYLTVT